MLADNLLHAPQLPDALRDDVSQMEQLARNVAQRLKQGNEAQLPEYLPISELLEKLQQHLRHLAPTLSFSQQLDSDPCVADTEGWFRVLCNLGYNAMDAGATRLAITLQAQGQHYRLQVSDDGPAHAASEREGMGIGLTLVSTTLQQLGASLEMEFGPRWTQARMDWPKLTEPTA